MTAKIILASASPRRRELLAQIGIQCDVIPAHIDETPRSGERPAAYVIRVAAEKSLQVWQQQSPSLPVLAADTSVVIDDKILGKPADKPHAFNMLQQLSGRTHQVFTAVSVRADQHKEKLSVTDVTFRKLTKAEIMAYCETGEPNDKAGAYGIQGKGAIFVQSIQGSFSGVVGLPLLETAELLNNIGIHVV
ncbi:MAG: Maf family protein [Methylococcaceae bacterium]